GTDCTLITGNDGNITIGETGTQEVNDATGKHYHAYVTAIMAWLGLQIGSIHSVGRIVNLTEDAGKGLTDDLIYKALEKFPSSKQPNLIVMNRRSLRQLRDSRTATNATGAPAPRPTEVEGIPIVTTDSIVSTEELVA
ncbi:MAG: major capsid protein, partial [Planctomycetota bacterium]